MWRGYRRRGDGQREPHEDCTFALTTVQDQEGTLRRWGGMPVQAGGAAARLTKTDAPSPVRRPTRVGRAGAILKST